MVLIKFYEFEVVFTVSSFVGNPVVCVMGIIFVFVLWIKKCMMNQTMNLSNLGITYWLRASFIN